MEENSAAGAAKNRRGRDHRKRRTHGDQKENDKGNGAPRGGSIRLGPKNIVLIFKNESTLAKTYEFWYDESPASGDGWKRGKGPEDLAAGTQTQYQSPTRSAGIWISGPFGHYWIKAFNPLAGTPEVNFRFEGTIAEGVGHTGGIVTGPSMAALKEGEQLWGAQAHFVYVRREEDSDFNKIYTIRLGQAFS